MKLRSLALAALLALPGAALAGPLSYSYVQGSYQIWTEDPHTWVLRGSYQVAENVYVMLEDTSGMRNAGAGYFFPVQQNLHLYGELSLADSLDGFRPVLEGGARMAVSPELEVRGAIRYIEDGAGLDDEILFIGEGAYHFSPRLAGVAAVAIPTENDGVFFQFGARFSF